MGALDGKVAIVTGSGSGIGRATAMLYALEGAKVVIADKRGATGEATAQAIRDGGGDATAIETDVSHTDQVQRLIADTESKYGALHVMTANAGIIGRAHGVPLADVEEQDFQQLLDTNLIGVFLCFKYAIPLVRRSGGGAFTATSSLGARRGYGGLTAYCASKGGVSAMVRALSLELAPEIRVNAVLPGGVATNVAQHRLEEMGLPDDDEPVDLLEDAPYRWLGEPGELAAAHLWLASDAASFVTGQEIIVDGGAGVAVPAVPLSFL